MSLANARDLTDTQWQTLDGLIPEPSRRQDGRGRPWKDRRASLEWYFVGATDGRSMGGRVGALSVVPDLPSPIPAMGSLWNHEGDSGGARSQSQSRWCSRR